MKMLRQLWTHFRVLASARRNRLGAMGVLARRRPQLLLGTTSYETGLLLSARVDGRLKVLAETKVASIVACEYCLDIVSALARHEGLTEVQLRDLPVHRTSPAFDEQERVVLDVADALTRVPAVVDDELRMRLDAAFSPAQQAELLSVIAWENHRARLNQGLGVQPSGFSDGQYCILPETADPPTNPFS